MSSINDVLKAEIEARQRLSAREFNRMALAGQSDPNAMQAARSMNEQEILLAQIQMEAVRRKQAQRMRDALAGDHHKLSEAIFEDACRIVLSMDLTVKPEDLRDDAKLRELAAQRFGFGSWHVAPQFGTGPLFDPEAALFRTKVAVLQHFVEVWLDAARDLISAEREVCARIADELAADFDAEEKGCWNDGESAANACRQVAAKIRSGK